MEGTEGTKGFYGKPIESQKQVTPSVGKDTVSKVFTQGMKQLLSHKAKSLNTRIDTRTGKPLIAQPHTPKLPSTPEGAIEDQLEHLHITPKGTAKEQLEQVRTPSAREKLAIDQLGQLEEIEGILRKIEELNEEIEKGILSKETIADIVEKIKIELNEEIEKGILSKETIADIVETIKNIDKEQNEIELVKNALLTEKTKLLAEKTLLLDSTNKPLSSPRLKKTTQVPQKAQVEHGQLSQLKDAHEERIKTKKQMEEIRKKAEAAQKHKPKSVGRFVIFEE